MYVTMRTDDAGPGPGGQTPGERFVIIKWPMLSNFSIYMVGYFNIRLQVLSSTARTSYLFSRKPYFHISQVDFIFAAKKLAI